MSSEFHACGAAPREVRKALARFDTKHVPYFMLVTGWLGPLSLNPRTGRTTAGVMWLVATATCGLKTVVGRFRAERICWTCGFLDPVANDPQRHFATNN